MGRQEDDTFADNEMKEHPDLRMWQRNELHKKYVKVSDALIN